MIPPGLSYWIRNKLYISLTNECISLSPISLRGPSFIMPKDSLFQPLTREPTALEVVEVIDAAFDSGKINVSSIDSDEITFAGLGEPLLRLETLAEAIKLIKQKRHGVPIRLKTNGLINSKLCDKVNYQN